ncbi:hypothetical protein CBR_g4039 [Chara braunii]|uniref:Uncharacterized protein n=2 Tax=Chara braunii TaxID=69332 RepID=A0A388KH22_CHABU|nr:hypothetical protein CBR_g4039 [Chara braunii]|eukprot:GBG69342.1 hypothetical protein CBR_g4039 [Chara braunii]
MKGCHRLIENLNNILISIPKDWTRMLRGPYKWGWGDWTTWSRSVEPQQAFRIGQEVGPGEDRNIGGSFTAHETTGALRSVGESSGGDVKQQAQYSGPVGQTGQRSNPLVSQDQQGPTAPWRSCRCRCRDKSKCQHICCKKTLALYGSTLYVEGQHKTGKHGGGPGGTRPGRKAEKEKPRVEPGGNFQQPALPTVGTNWGRSSSAFQQTGRREGDFRKPDNGPNAYANRCVPSLAGMEKDGPWNTAERGGNRNDHKDGPDVFHQVRTESHGPWNKAERGDNDNGHMNTRDGFWHNRKSAGFGGVQEEAHHRHNFDEQANLRGPYTNQYAPFSLSTQSNGTPVTGGTENSANCRKDGEGRSSALCGAQEAQHHGHVQIPIFHSREPVRFSSPTELPDRWKTNGTSGAKGGGPSGGATTAPWSAIGTAGGTSDGTNFGPSCGPSHGTTGGPRDGTIGGPSGGVTTAPWGAIGTAGGTSDGTNVGPSCAPSHGTTGGPRDGTIAGPSYGTSGGPSYGTSGELCEVASSGTAHGTTRGATPGPWNTSATVGGTSVGPSGGTGGGTSGGTSGGLTGGVIGTDHCQNDASPRQDSTGQFGAHCENGGKGDCQQESVCRSSTGVDDIDTVGDVSCKDNPCWDSMGGDGVELTGGPSQEEKAHLNSTRVNVVDRHSPEMMAMEVNCRPAVARVVRHFPEGNKPQKGDECHSGVSSALTSGPQQSGHESQFSATRRQSRAFGTTSRMEPSFSKMHTNRDSGGENGTSSGCRNVFILRQLENMEVPSATDGTMQSRQPTHNDMQCEFRTNTGQSEAPSASGWKGIVTEEQMHSEMKSDHAMSTIRRTGSTLKLAPGINESTSNCVQQAPGWESESELSMVVAQSKSFSERPREGNASHEQVQCHLLGENAGSNSRKAGCIQSSQFNVFASNLCKDAESTNTVDGLSGQQHSVKTQLSVTTGQSMASHGNRVAANFSKENMQLHYASKEGTCNTHGIDCTTPSQAALFPSCKHQKAATSTAQATQLAIQSLLCNEDQGKCNNMGESSTVYYPPGTEAMVYSCERRTLDEYRLPTHGRVRTDLQRSSHQSRCAGGTGQSETAVSESSRPICSNESANQLPSCISRSQIHGDIPRGLWQSRFPPASGQRPDNSGLAHKYPESGCHPTETTITMVNGSAEHRSPNMPTKQNFSDVHPFRGNWVANPEVDPWTPTRSSTCNQMVCESRRPQHGPSVIEMEENQQPIACSSFTSEGQLPVAGWKTPLCEKAELTGHKSWTGKAPPRNRHHMTEGCVAGHLNISHTRGGDKRELGDEEGSSPCQAFELCNHNMWAKKDLQNQPSQLGRNDADELSGSDAPAPDARRLCLWKRSPSGIGGTRDPKDSHGCRGSMHADQKESKNVHGVEENGSHAQTGCRYRAEKYRSTREEVKLPGEWNMSSTYASEERQLSVQEGSLHRVAETCNNEPWATGNPRWRMGLGEGRLADQPDTYIHPMGESRYHEWRRAPSRTDSSINCNIAGVQSPANDRSRGLGNCARQLTINRNSIHTPERQRTLGQKTAPFRYVEHFDGRQGMPDSMNTNRPLPVEGWSLLEDLLRDSLSSAEERQLGNVEVTAGRAAEAGTHTGALWDNRSQRGRDLMDRPTDKCSGFYSSEENRVANGRPKQNTVPTGGAVEPGTHVAIPWDCMSQRERRTMDRRPTRRCAAGVGSSQENRLGHSRTSFCKMEETCDNEMQGVPSDYLPPKGSRDNFEKSARNQDIEMVALLASPSDKIARGQCQPIFDNQANDWDTDCDKVERVQKPIITPAGQGLGFKFTQGEEDNPAGSPELGFENLIEEWNGNADWEIDCSKGDSVHMTIPADLGVGHLAKKQYHAAATPLDSGGSHLTQNRAHRAFAHPFEEWDMEWGTSNKRRDEIWMPSGQLEFGCPPCKQDNPAALPAASESVELTQSQARWELENNSIKDLDWNHLVDTARGHRSDTVLNTAFRKLWQSNTSPVGKDNFHPPTKTTNTTRSHRGSSQLLPATGRAKSQGNSRVSLLSRKHSALQTWPSELSRQGKPDIGGFCFYRSKRPAAGNHELRKSKKRAQHSTDSENAHDNISAVSGPTASMASCSLSDDEERDVRMSVWAGGPAFVRSRSDCSGSSSTTSSSVFPSSTSLKRKCTELHNTPSEDNCAEPLSARGFSATSLPSARGDYIDLTQQDMDSVQDYEELPRVMGSPADSSSSAKRKRHTENNANPDEDCGRLQGVSSFAARGGSQPTQQRIIKQEIVAIEGEDDDGSDHFERVADWCDYHRHEDLEDQRMQNMGAPQIQGYGNGVGGGNQPGVVSCYICGKVGHYARNWWAAGSGRQPVQQQPIQPMAAVDDETKEMREYFREKIRKRKLDEERREREEEERRRKEEENRREQERLREADAREARLEAKLGRQGVLHITVTKGTIWSDSWRVVRGKVGESTVMVGGVEKPIRECKRIMEGGGRFQVGKVAADIIRGAMPDQDIARFVAARVRVVVRKRLTVGMIIHNHLKYADGGDARKGATLLVCPVLYLRACKETFNWNRSFQVINETEAQVLGGMKMEYERLSLKGVARWQTGGRIGRAYVLPKDKDLDRWRPISPGTNDPARLAGARVGRAIRYMLFGVRRTEHFDLRSTDELKERCEAFQREMGKGGDGVLARSYDIKDMFAKLSHQRVMEAVEWLIMYHEKRGMKGARVSQRGKLCAMRTLRKVEGLVTLGFDDIRKEVDFELTYIYVGCTRVVLRQIFRIPMGRNSSPALACLVCARSEATFMRQVTRSGMMVRGMRMIDDVAVMVGFRTNHMDTMVKAATILDEFEKCYDEDLKLVRKDGGGNVFDFIGVCIFILMMPIRIEIHPRTRNQQSLCKEGRLRIQSLQDFASFTRKASKKATVFAALVRMHRILTSEEAMKAAIVALMLETRLRGYPPKISLGALARATEMNGCSESPHFEANGSGQCQVELEGLGISGMEVGKFSRVLDESQGREVLECETSIMEKKVQAGEEHLILDTSATSSMSPSPRLDIMVLELGSEDATISVVEVGKGMRVVDESQLSEGREVSGLDESQGRQVLEDEASVERVMDEGAKIMDVSSLPQMQVMGSNSTGQSCKVSSAIEARKATQPVNESRREVKDQSAAKAVTEEEEEQVVDKAMVEEEKIMDVSSLQQLKVMSSNSTSQRKVSSAIEVCKATQPVSESRMEVKDRSVVKAVTEEEEEQVVVKAMVEEENIIVDMSSLPQMEVLMGSNSTSQGMVSSVMIGFSSAVNESRVEEKEQSVVKAMADEDKALDDSSTLLDIELDYGADDPHKDSIRDACSFFKFLQ